MTDKFYMRQRRVFIVIRILLIILTVALWGMVLTHFMERPADLSMVAAGSPGNIGESIQGLFYNETFRDLIATLLITLLMVAVFFLIEFWRKKERIHEKQVTLFIEEQMVRLTAAEAQHRTLLEGIEQGILIFEPYTKEVLYSNRAACKILNIQPGGAISYAVINNLVSPADYRVIVERLHSEGEFGPLRIKSEIECQPGDITHLELTYSRTLYNQNTALMITLVDVTERWNTEETIHKKANEFAALYAMSRKLAVQHDLMTMLRELLDYAAALLSVEFGEILLYHPEDETLELKVIKGSDIELGVRQSIQEGASGMAAKTLQPVIIEDYSSWEGRMKKYDINELNSLLAVPMTYGGKLIGALAVFERNRREHKFNEADARLLDMFASQAAAAIHNAMLLEETNKRNLELEAINRISNILRSAENLDVMLPQLLDGILEILGTKTGCVWLIENPGDKVKEYVGCGWFSKPSKELIKILQEKTANSTEESGGYLTDHFNENAPELIGEQYPIPPGWGGGCFPIKIAGEMIGVLCIAKESQAHFNANEIQLIGTITEVAASGIQRVRLFEQTEQRLSRISALFDIDTVINTSLDLRLTLKVLLDQVTTQLKVDATDILLYHPGGRTLDFAAGLRFRTSGVEHMQIKIGEDYAGKAVLDGKPVYVPDLSGATEHYMRSQLMRLEGFISYYGTPLISKGEVIGVLEIFQRTLLEPDPEWLDFLNALAAQAAIAINNASLFEDLQKTNRELVHAYDATIEGWVQALDFRDQETEGHSQRVADMTVRLARLVGVVDGNLIDIRRAALLHDIGKIAIPDSILRKPGTLTQDEWVTMKKHPVYAYDMLSTIPFLQPVIDIPYCHHEKWDGSGYPRGLSGQNIPLLARLFAVIDVYDALTSDRPYRKAWNEGDAIQHIQDQSGKHFDPQIVEWFLEMLGGS